MNPLIIPTITILLAFFALGVIRILNAKPRPGGRLFK